MKWDKKGIIYKPTGLGKWAQHSCLQPTPLVLNNRIRIFVGFRDGDGVSRIGYIDVDAMDPSKVINVSSDPVLDIGMPGDYKKAND